DALSMEMREVIVIATGNVAISRELTPLVQERLPDIARILAVPSANEIEEFDALGMVPVDMSASGGTERIIEAVFASLGKERRLPVPSLASDEEVALEYA
ncbi:MAG: potassium transporter KefB, partial [Pseudomonadota bacterium]